MKDYIPRLAEGELKKLLKTKKVIMVLGARQAGKTTLLKKVLVTQSTRFLNMDLEVDRRKLMSASVVEPDKGMISLGSPKFLVIDEAQRLPEVGRIVKGWFDSKVTTQIILSGSSSLDLLDQSAESLTGRNYKLYLPPLVFEEVLKVQSWYSEVLGKELLKNFSRQIESLLLSLLTFGSYPEAVTADDKVRYLTTLVADYLLKDILQSGLVKEPNLIQRLLSLLAHQTGSEVSVNELANNLSLTRKTVERYLDLLERTFIIFRLPAYSANPRKEIVKSQKIYFWDTGARNALIGELNLNPLRSDIGRLWENWVVAEVAKKKMLEGNVDSLYFWRSRAGSEVDLVVKTIRGKLEAYEIKWSPGKVKARAFSNRYKIPVKAINRENFVEYLV